MQSFTIGTLNLINNGQPTTGILLQTPIKGLDSPAQRMNTIPNPGNDGAAVSSQFLDARLIELTGKIEGTSPAQFESLRQQLISSVAIQRDSNNYPQPVRISFTTLGGSSYYVDCYFNQPIIPLDGTPIDSSFLITAVAPDPFLYATTTLTSGVISPPSGGGYTVPMILPYISAAATGGSVVLNNAGSATAWPTLNSDGSGGIRLTGPLTNPVITNVTTGTLLQLGSYTIASGDVVVIDMKKHTITINGLSLISQKTATSDWWGLAPGNNTITLTTSSTSDTGSMTLAYNTPYIGT